MTARAERRRSPKSVLWSARNSRAGSFHDLLPPYDDDMQLREWQRDDYVITNDESRLDLDVIHGFLTRSYWAKGRSREAVQTSIERSLPFGLYRGGTQIGFARVVTDEVVLAFLADVFVVEAYRGRGYHCAQSSKP